MDRQQATDTGSPDCSHERLTEVFVGGQPWLVKRIAHYAREHGYAGHGDGTDNEWFESVSGISDAMFQASYRPDVLRDHNAHTDSDHDPVTAFAVLRARTQFDRRTSLPSWLGLMKYYRRSYAELLDASQLDVKELSDCRIFVDRFFDRLEIGFCAEWSRLMEHSHIPQRVDEQARSSV